MKPSESQDELKKRLGPSIDAITPRRALDAMSAFYAEQRADDVAIDQDGDMLLYQWGVYSFTKPESFRLGITRQFIVTDEDEPYQDEPYQLHLTLHFDPTPALRQLERGSEWCRTPEELADFRRIVESSAPFKALADTKPSRVDLRFEQC